MGEILEIRKTLREDGKEKEESIWREGVRES